MTALSFFSFSSFLIVIMLFCQKTIPTAIAGFIVTCFYIMILILKLTFLPIKTPNDGPNFALGPAFAPNPLYQV